MNAPACAIALRRGQGWYVYLQALLAYIHEQLLGYARRAPNRRLRQDNPWPPRAQLVS
jgi:hypothetical protein